MIVNKEACFFYAPNLDVTDLIIAEMDKRFEEEKKKLSLNAQPVEVANKEATKDAVITPAKEEKK